MAGPDVPESLLYLRKSNGRKAVPRQRVITTAFVIRLGSRIREEFPDADSTAFRKVDGAQPVRDEFRHQTNPLTRPPDPAELLETVARALALALIPLPRQTEPPRAEQPADFLTAAQLALRLGISRETVRRLAITGTLPHTVVCRGAPKTTRRFPRRFADDFAASGLDVADLAAFAAHWRARVTAPVR
jgi:excisionase family DNA binding protein